MSPIPRRGNRHLLVLMMLIIVEVATSQRRGRKCDESSVMVVYKEVTKLKGLQQDLLDQMENLTLKIDSLNHSQKTRDFEHLTSFLEATLPEDCSVARARGSWKPFNKIAIPGEHIRDVRCDQKTAGGGWTVVLTRSSKHPHTRPHPHPHPSNTLDNGKWKNKETQVKPSTINRIQKPDISKALHEGNEGAGTRLESFNFNRTWDEYKTGFGDPRHEYWLGNEAMHLLTSIGEWEARVELEDWSHNVGSGTWSHFRILGEDEQYRLEISGYNSTESDVNDAISFHNNRRFSTYDRDNDQYSGDHCAKTYGCGWWYHQCHRVLLTGEDLGPGARGDHGIHWDSWQNNMALKMATFMIRPRQ